MQALGFTGQEQEIPSLSQGGTTDGSHCVTESPRFHKFISGIYSLTHDVSIPGRRVTTDSLGAIKLLGTAHNQGRYNLAQKTYFSEANTPQMAGRSFQSGAKIQIYS